MNNTRRHLTWIPHHNTVIIDKHDFFVVCSYMGRQFGLLPAQKQGMALDIAVAVVDSYLYTQTRS